MWRSLAGGREVDGVVLIAPPVDLFEHQVGLDDKPVVLCACRPEDRRNGWSRVPTVTVDNVTPMKQLVERLVEVDCRRIVLLAGPHDIYDAIQREQTFRESVRQFPNVQGDVWRGACTQETGYSMTAEYLAKHHGPPDAFMAFNDAVAVGVLQCLREHGLRVPDDVRVTGWDDLMFMEFAGLSSVHLPMVEMGNEAARLLYRLIDGEGQPLPPRDKHLVLEQPVVLRGSTE
jgi:DNA-binding LacI/PurR family transcriptional regulator